jgi:hypothetical protein
VTEVILVLVMIGLIAVPLTTSLYQAVTLVPDAQERSKASVDVAFFADQFATDVSNTKDVTIPEVAIGYVKTGACTTTTVAQNLYAAWLNPAVGAGYVVYQFNATDVNGGTQVPGDQIKVDIFRVPGGEVFLTGYCTYTIPLTTFITVTSTDSMSGVAQNHRLIRVETTLAAYRGGHPNSIDFEAALGCTYDATYCPS